MDMNNWKEQLRAEFQMEEMPTLESFITSLLASERAHWLRSEIEKLQRMYRYERSMTATMFNEALTSIITRYKEELLELGNGK